MVQGSPLFHAFRAAVREIPVPEKVLFADGTILQFLQACKESGIAVEQAVYNQDGVLCAEGTVVLGFINSATGRVMPCPPKFLSLMEKMDVK